MAPPPPAEAEEEEEASFKKRLAALKPLALKATFFRIIPERYRDEILSVQGSLRYGGRYNPKGEFGVLYLAASPEVAQAEILRKVGEVPEALREPRVCGAVRVSLKRVLDLTEERTLKGLGIRREDLLQNTGNQERDYRLPRRIARLARAMGFEALKVPSVTSRGNNLVLFPENIKEPSQVQVEATKPIALP